MITILVAALVTTLGFGGLMAFRYVKTGNRLGLVMSAAIAVETIALGLLFVVLSSDQFGAGRWLDVPLKHLALQAAGFAITAGVLGFIYFIIHRLPGGGLRRMEAVFLGLLILSANLVREAQGQRVS